MFLNVLIFYAFNKNGGNKMKREIVCAVDGDTIKTKRKIDGTNYVRLAGVDAPEKGQKGYEFAKRRLNTLIKGKSVSIVQKAKDKYGRVVADVRLGHKKINCQSKFGGW